MRNDINRGKIGDIKGGTLISYIQMILSIIISLAYTPIMITKLGKSEYGLYNTVVSTISMLSILSLGFSGCYNQESIYKLNGVFLIMSLAVGVVAFFCGVYLCNRLDIVFGSGLKQEEYILAKKLMFLLTVNLAITFIMSVFANIISAHEKFIFLKSIGIIRTLGGPFLTIPLLLLGFRSVAVVSATLIISISVDIIYFIYTLKILKQKFVFRRFEKSFFKDLFIYIIFVAIHTLVDQINKNVDRVLLARFIGTEEVAIYSVGASLYSYYIQIGLPIATMFAPRIHKIIVAQQEDGEQRKNLTELFTKVGRVQFLVLGLISTGIIFFGQSFIYFWVGDGFTGSYYVAVLLIISGTIDLIQNIGIEIQRAQNKHWFRAVVYLGMTIINIILTIFLCQRYGAIGSAIGTAISFVVGQGLIINIYYHKKCNINIGYFFKEIVKLCRGLIIPIIIGVLIMEFASINTIWQLLLFIILYSTAYGISMWFIGMNKYEKNLASSLLAKVSKK